MIKQNDSSSTNLGIVDNRIIIDKLRDELEIKNLVIAWLNEDYKRLLRRHDQLKRKVKRLKLI